MKKILFVLLAIIFTSSSKSQSIISSIKKSHPKSLFQSFKTKNIDKSYLKVTNLSSRNAIEDKHRIEGMIIWVISIGKFYYLSNGITNSHWVELPIKSTRYLKSTDKFNINKTDTILSLGDSFTEGYTLASPEKKSYVSLLNKKLGTTKEAYPIGGSGVVNAWKQFLEHTTIVDNKKNITFLSGFNDLKLSGANTKTYYKIKGIVKSIIASSFLKTCVAAKSAIKTGRWTNITEENVISKSHKQLSDTPIQISETGVLQHTFKGENIVIGVLNVGTNLPGGTFSVLIDGVKKLVYDNSNRTDDLRDYHGLNNKLVEDVVLLRNLGSRSHTLQIVRVSGTIYVDFFGTLNESPFCKSVLIAGFPKLSNYNLFAPYDNGSDMIFDTAELHVKGVINEFYGYSTKFIDVNNYWNKNTDLFKDEVHPNELGHVHLTHAFSEQLSLFSNILFKFNEYTLTEEAKIILQNIQPADTNTTFKNVKIYGHTDQIGSDNYNNKLSYKRANTVKQFLLKNGIQATIINPIEGKGKRELVVNKIDTVSRQQNRRVTIIFEYTFKTAETIVETKLTKDMVAKKIERKRHLNKKNKDSSVKVGDYIRMKDLNFHGSRQILL